MDGSNFSMTVGPISDIVMHKDGFLLTDLAAVGITVKIILKVRKFRCRNSNCIQIVFSEQHLSLTQKCSRLTGRTSHYLQRLLIEVSSRKGE